MTWKKKYHYKYLYCKTKAENKNKDNKLRRISSLQENTS